jgi:hypothetical protein
MDAVFKFVENSIGRIPIIGTVLSAVIIMVVGVGYWIGFITFLTFILIPCMLILGIINPDKVEGKFPFDSIDDIGMWNRFGFALVLTIGYGLPVGSAIYFIFFSR